MQKFMCIHNLGPNQLTRPQVDQLAQALQHDPQVHGYRSFLNLSEGKVLCILEADSRNDIANWFQQHQVPVDSITPVELEGERGDVREVRQDIPMAAGV